MINVDVWGGSPGPSQYLVKSYKFDTWEEAFPVIRAAADAGFLVYTVSYME